jgi:hypothetical protein
VDPSCVPRYALIVSVAVTYPVMPTNAKPQSRLTVWLMSRTFRSHVIREKSILRLKFRVSSKGLRVF